METFPAIIEISMSQHPNLQDIIKQAQPPQQESPHQLHVTMFTYIDMCLQQRQQETHDTSWGMCSLGRKVQIGDNAYVLKSFYW